MASFDQKGQKADTQFNAENIYISGERAGTPNWEPGSEYCTITREVKTSGRKGTYDPYEYVFKPDPYQHQYYKAQAQGPRGMYVVGEADELDRLFNQLISDGWEFIGTEEKTKPNGFMDQRWRFRRKVK